MSHFFEESKDKGLSFSDWVIPYEAPPEKRLHFYLNDKAGHRIYYRYCERSGDVQQHIIECCNFENGHYNCFVYETLEEVQYLGFIDDELLESFMKLQMNVNDVLNL